MTFDYFLNCKSYHIIISSKTHLLVTPNLPPNHESFVLFIAVYVINSILGKHAQTCHEWEIPVLRMTSGGGKSISRTEPKKIIPGRFAKVDLQAGHFVLSFSQSCFDPGLIGLY